MPGLTGIVNLRYAEGMTAGFGYNFATASPLSVVVEPSSDTLQPIKEADGLITTYSCIIIDSIESLNSHMSSSIGASGRNMYGSASVSLSEEQLHLFNSHATFILARIQVRNPFKQFTGTARLAQRGLDMLHAGHSQAFKDAYGDGYIRGMATGGEYYAIISVLSNNELEQKKVSVHISGRLSGGAANANASLDSEVQSYLSTTRIEIRTYQASGAAAQSAVIEPDFKSLGRRMRDFPTFVFQHPVPIFMQVAPFSTLSNWPGNTALLDVDHQMEMLAHYKKIEFDYVTLQNDITFIQNHGEYFLEKPQVLELNKWQRFIAGKLEKLRAAYNSCSTRGICPSDIAYELPPGYKLPVRKDTSLSDEDSILLGKTWKIKVDGDSASLIFRRNLSTNTFTGTYYERGIESQAVQGITALIYLSGEKNKLVTIVCNLAKMTIFDTTIKGIAINFQGFLKGLDEAYGCLLSNIARIEPNKFDGTPRWTAEIIRTDPQPLLSSSSTHSSPSTRALSLLDADFAGPISSSSSIHIAAMPSPVARSVLVTSDSSEPNTSGASLVTLPVRSISISMFKNIFSPPSQRKSFLMSLFNEFYPDTKENALRYAVVNDDLSSVSDILSLEHVNINYRDPVSGKTVLHEAYAKGNTEIIALLLTLGADETIMDNEGKLPKDYFSSEQTLRL